MKVLREGSDGFEVGVFELDLLVRFHEKAVDLVLGGLH